MEISNEQIIGLVVTVFCFMLIMIPVLKMLKSADEDIKFLRAERERNQANASA